MANFHFSFVFVIAQIFGLIRSSTQFLNLKISIGSQDSSSSITQLIIHDQASCIVGIGAYTSKSTAFLETLLFSSTTYNISFLLNMEVNGHISISYIEFHLCNNG